MSLAPVQSVETSRPVILFIDDEQRVLKSMRAMFRRDFDVHLANSGEEALAVIDQQEVDVVVSDQRMPHMTGVEVLTEIKQRAPDTVRILLTGYADLAAVEASINEAEVFKYLMKPCPADEIRSALQEGLELREGGMSLAGVVGEAIDHTPGAPEEALPSNVARLNVAKPQKQAKAASQTPANQAAKVQVMVLSQDGALMEGVKNACPGQTVHHAKDLDQALAMVAQHPIGVMVTDVAVDEKEIGKLSKAVRKIVPEIVIVLASERSDANVLIQLINSGQVFRFLLKPLQAAQCKIWLTSAAKRFLQSGGRALSSVEEQAATLSGWARFKNWLLGARS